MADIQPIRTETDYRAALARIDTLMDADPGTPEERELDVLVDLVELYESRHEPMGYPSPVAAIEFRMEQAGLQRRDLIPFIGSRATVSEVLSGKRAITDVDGAGAPPAPRNSRRCPAASASGDIRRRTGRHRVSSAPGPDARAEDLCWRALAVAARTAPHRDYRPGAVTPDLLRHVARLSPASDGPQRALAFLAGKGIPFVIIEHLPRTYLDGAALQLADGRPVVALTLRYDRLDNFWFCLLHELAHVGRHMDSDDGHAFIDDLTLRGVDIIAQDPREAQADEWADDALIPRAAWETTPSYYGRPSRETRRVRTRS